VVGIEPFVFALGFPQVFSAVDSRHDILEIMDAFPRAADSMKTSCVTIVGRFYELVAQRFTPEFAHSEFRVA
jgi:hypothetical protein